ncbi:MAG: hypothetical protein LQ351_005159 [Letrouitia transgressa]|nr:MAG: hypothetical protein LQ351_005159 [Letrouitia transgressa]
MDLSNFSSSSDPKTAILNQIRQEAAVNNARLLITKVNSHCFDKCVPSPGSSLSRKEEGCFTQCMEKYMDTWNTVSRQYIARVQRSSEAGGSNIEQLGI